MGVWKEYIMINKGRIIKGNMEEMKKGNYGQSLQLGIF